jgi:autotransporter-associated beta strand protein
MKLPMNKKIVREQVKLNLIKSVMAGCGMLLMLSSAQAQFTWPVYEAFGEYTNGTILGVPGVTTTNAASPWWGSSGIGNGVGSSQPIVFDYEALSYPALVADTNSTPRGVSSASVTGSHDAAAPFTSHSGNIYASFLINNINNQTTTIDRMMFSLNTGTSASSGFGMSVYLTTDYRLKIRKNPSGSPSGAFTSPTPALSTNATHLVVIRYRTNSIAGAPDSVDLWLDPTPFGNVNSIPPPTLSTTNGANVSSATFKLLVLPSRGAGLYTFFMDEIRLGDTWASVTPLATPAPGPLFTVSGGGAACAGGGVDVNLSGSVATNDYRLFTNNIWTGFVQTGNGSPIDFGIQTVPAVYSVLASNTTTSALGWMSNSVLVTVIQPPVILTNPVPVVTATNNRAAFTAVVTGDNLDFHWYRDGTVLTNDSHLTGATTNALVISPATTTDIGNYYCIITNSCGVVAITTTNSLTLDAPNNLVWAGDGFNVDVWDVYATLAEWSGGSGYFNPGDNVTFDDTYTFATGVTLNGILTPTSINVNAARDYLWGGGGTIAGSTSLVKANTGRLIISNNVASAFLANPYTGGTVISNGLVYVQAANALGSGPIVLAAGGLETLGKLSFSNNVFVTANSICQLDQSGQQSITFLGPVIGSSGTTLVFTNSSTLTNSQNWVVLSAPATNNSAIVLAVLKNATNSTQRLNLNINTNLSQIFNGPISDLIFTTDSGGIAGGGGVIKQGAGAAYLNAANTYTLGTTNLAGLLAGSGSISGPLAVYTNGIIGAGTAGAIGKFTVSNSITFIGGNVFIRVDKSLSQSNDMIVATGVITNTGTGPVSVTVTNLNSGMPLVAGNRFQIFSGAVSNGTAFVVTGGGVSWTNNLAVDGSVQVLPGDHQFQSGGRECSYQRHQWSVGRNLLSLDDDQCC